MIHTDRQWLSLQDSGCSCTYSSQRRGAGSTLRSRPRQQPGCTGLSCETSPSGRPEAGWSLRTGPLQSPSVLSYCRYQTALRKRRIFHNLKEERWKSRSSREERQSWQQQTGYIYFLADDSSLRVLDTYVFHHVRAVTDVLVFFANYIVQWCCI